MKPRLSKKRLIKVTILDLICEGRDQISIEAPQVENPYFHMEQIVAGALGWKPSTLFMRLYDEATVTERDRVHSFLSRRLKGEPYQYILGRQLFWQSEFEVGPGVLVPRPETEHVIDAALKLLADNRIVVAELGGGSGNIGISLLLERPNWEWHVFEKSSVALSYLKRNRDKLLNSKNYFVYEGDFFEQVALLGQLDAIVSNPPYIASPLLNDLQLEVRSEPVLALDGGRDGLYVIRNLIKKAATHLKPGGTLIFEIGFDQKESVVQLFDNLWHEVNVINDYSDKPRVVAARLNVKH